MRCKFSIIASVVRRAGIDVDSLGTDARGNVAIIFAVAAVAVGVGAGLDSSGAYAAHQRLSEVATFTCQYAIRESVLPDRYGRHFDLATYRCSVN